MATPRTRSEYRFAIEPGAFRVAGPGMTRPDAGHREALAELLLDAYAGTVDDEGETTEEALEAAEDLLATCDPAHSFVLERDGGLDAVSLVVEVDGVSYINLVAVAADRKRTGLGRRIVEASLASLSVVGVREVGATITDGNTASEALFARFGATRTGAWPA